MIELIVTSSTGIGEMCLVAKNWLTQAKINTIVLTIEPTSVFILISPLR